MYLFNAINGYFFAFVQQKKDFFSYTNTKIFSSLSIDHLPFSLLYQKMSTLSFSIPFTPPPNDMDSERYDDDILCHVTVLLCTLLVNYIQFNFFFVIYIIILLDV